MTTNFDPSPRTVPRPTAAVEGIWLRREAGHICVAVERDGAWTDVIAEPAEGPISHIVDASDIEESILLAEQLA